MTWGSDMTIIIRVISRTERNMKTGYVLRFKQDVWSLYYHMIVLVITFS